MIKKWINYSKTIELKIEGNEVYQDEQEALTAVFITNVTQSCVSQTPKRQIRKKQFENLF